MSYYYYYYYYIHNVTMESAEDKAFRGVMFAVVTIVMVWTLYATAVYLINPRASEGPPKLNYIEFMLQADAMAAQTLFVAVIVLGIPAIAYGIPLGLVMAVCSQITWFNRFGLRKTAALAAGVLAAWLAFSYTTWDGRRKLVLACEWSRRAEACQELEATSTWLTKASDISTYPLIPLFFVVHLTLYGK